MEVSDSGVQNRVCGNCIYWVRELTPTDEAGTCRRHAPRPELRVSKSIAAEIVMPQVNADFWCGEIILKNVISDEGEPDVVGII